MPERSLRSPVLRWPDLDAVDAAARRWAGRQPRLHPELLQLGYFGSCARGDWGVGSDLDLIAILAESRLPFEKRSLGWDRAALPVPAEILIYTLAEWEALQRSGGLLLVPWNGTWFGCGMRLGAGHRRRKAGGHRRRSGNGN